MLYPKRADKDAYHLSVLRQPESFGFRVWSFNVKRSEDVALQALYLEALQENGQQRRITFSATLKGIGKESLLNWTTPRGTIFLLHGRNSIKEHWFPIAEKLTAVGYNLILMDSRAHGGSGGCCTYGMEETQDVAAVVEHARREFAIKGPLGVMGFSLGGAVAAQLVGNQPEFKAVVMVSVFSSLEDMTAQIGANRYGKFASWMMPAVRQQVKWKAGFDVDQISPEQAARRIRVPAFVIHGGKDQFVAPTHGEKILAALPNQEKQWLLVNDAGHADLFVKAGDDLIIEIAEFFAQHLK